VQRLSSQRASAANASASASRSTAAFNPAAIAAPTISPAEVQRSIADSASLIERTLLSECNLLLGQPHSPGVSRIVPGAGASLQSKHQQNNHITSNYERLAYERDAKLSVLANDLNNSNARIQELAAHKKRLLEQVALCDQEIGALTTRSNALSADLTANAHYYQQQLDQLAQTGKHRCVVAVRLSMNFWGVVYGNISNRRSAGGSRVFCAHHIFDS
jgi:septal ring factor EnvC (AmiA/AmiB activator)